jgi:DNA repair protein RAD50
MTSPTTKPYFNRNEAAISSNRVDQVKTDISDLENSIQSTSNQITSADERLAVIEKDEADRRGIERDLQDQIRYRQTEVDLKNCDADLQELEEKQGEYNASNLRRELRKAQQEEANLVDRRGNLRGELGQMTNQIKRYETELSTDYANVDGRYGRLYIEVKTSELASIDLDKYSKTLQTAIMRYHSLKMEDLNKIIRDLWLTTYKGGGKL